MVLLDLRHKVYYLVLNINEIIDLIVNANEELLALTITPSCDIVEEQYSSPEFLKSLITQYYKAIDYCCQQDHKKIIDFGCGIGIGEIIFKNLFSDTDIIFESWARRSNRFNMNYYDFFLEKLNISPIYYNGDVNNEKFYAKRCDSPANAVICFRIIIKDNAIDNFYKNNIVDSNSIFLYTYARHIGNTILQLEDFRIKDPINKVIKIL